MPEANTIGAAAHEFGLYRDILVVLVTAAVIVPFVQRLRVSPVLGFLAAGVVLGPNGLGALSAGIPVLSWVTVGSEKNLAALGELGVVFLLFLIGLELSLKRLVTMRRLVFGLGGLQVVLSALAIAAAGAALGLDAGTASIVGLSLALSSTAIVVELLSEQHRLATATGRASFSILLLQDLAVVPLLLLVTLIGPGREGSALAGVTYAVGQACLAIGVIVVLGSLVLRPIFRLVAGSNNGEVFVAATLLVAVGSGLLSAMAGLSMAFGAFVAGLLLAETEFRRAIETTIDPFKGLLLGAFFFTVGMSVNAATILDNPLPILAATAALIAGKALIAALLVRLFRFPWGVAVETGLLIGACGEFAFIVTTQAELFSVISPEMAAFLKSVTALSMIFIPLLDMAGRRFSRRLEVAAPPDPVLAISPSEDHVSKAIVIGHGRVGRLVSDMLERHAIPHLVTERQVSLVSEARGEGRPVYFGDGKDTRFLARCGLSSAKAVIITIHTWTEIDDLVKAVRSLRPDIVIVARARDAEHASHLYELGVTDAVPETIEASLQLSEAALVGLGVPTGPVIASIHEKRDEFRVALQKAAGAGRESRGVRAKAAATKGA